MAESQEQQQGLHGTILVVDDERNIRRALRMVLEGEGSTVLDAGSAEEALALLMRRGCGGLPGSEAGAPEIDVMIADVLLPGISGLDLLDRLRELGGGTLALPVLLISGHATVSDAVRATRLGAFDFFEKPLVRDRVVVGVRNALRHARAERELRRLRGALRGEIIGESAACRALFRQIEKIGPTKARVLIEGESGTGKELVARAIHQASDRAERAFIKVNCAAIPRELIESELFGHERGAFTGATAQKRGLFEVADGGTIFLDEIGDMDLGAQAKVLRVLQSGELTRVGGERPIKVDVRVVAATHRNLRELVAVNEFREDLYFRLAVVPVVVPPLRERVGDVELLCRYYLDQSCRENGISAKRFSEEALALLSGYSWPGNVRELRNLMERLAILADGDIGVEDLPEELREGEEASASAAAETLVSFAEGAVPAGVSLKVFREAVERAFIRQRLGEHGWNVSRTAEALGVERTHLHKRMKLLGIARGA
ncbi:MAG: sigma-54-dependent Fis family transcriptional regulator [Nannocystis sp.]|nr:sigma-54-dependent Fis family transcriptional regulator [Nannocystis sp.]